MSRRGWVAVLLVCWGATFVLARPSVQRHPDEQAQFPGFVQLGDDGKTVCCDALYPEADDGTITWCDNCTKTDPCACGGPGAYARHEDGIWKCALGEGTFQCSDLGTCNLCDPTCTACVSPLGGFCTQTSDCCVGACVNGVCTIASCVAQAGDSCTQTSDCCEGFCANGVCTTTCDCGSTTSTTGAGTTSSTGAGTTSTTSTSTSTSTTSTTQTLTSSLLLEPFGTYEIGVLPSRTMGCIVERQATGIPNATQLTGGFSGGTFCSIAIYPDDDTGTVLAWITRPCPASPGGVINNAVAPFALAAGAAYRRCVCTSGGGQYTAIYANGGGSSGYNDLLNAYSTTIGAAANKCAAGTGQPPSTTGALTASSLFKIPYLAIE